MNTTIRFRARLLTVLSLLAAPLAAGAEETLAIAPQTDAGRLTIERVKSGFVVSPDVRFTAVDGEFANLAGVYAGWMTDRTFLVGAGGYWLTNRHDDFKMAYGGAVFEWAARGDRRFGFGARALFGAGRATLSSTAGELFGDRPDMFRDVGRAPSPFRGGRGPSFRGPERGLPSDRRLIFSDDFLVAEPQVDALRNVKDWLRVNGGVGYRFIGSAESMGERLRGVSGSFAVQLGGS